MKSFLLALQFLTVIPIRISKIKPGQISRSMAYFPIIGLLLGLALALANYALTSARFDPFTSNIILVVLLIILTGGLHLDGLSDTADALFSGKDKPEMLRIMRDSHVGAMGVLAIISVLLLKIAFLSAVGPELTVKALILMCVLSRWSMTSSLFAFPYARAEGKAKAFKDGMTRNIFIISTLAALAIAFFILRAAGIALFVITAAFTYMAGLRMKKKIGGVTGDTIGAVSELTEVVVLFGMAILEKSLYIT